MSQQENDNRDRSDRRPLMLGGIVVAFTLAIAAWLAYGVVQRSTSNPRAGGLVPGDTRAGTRTSANPNGRAGTTTTAPRGATSSTTRLRGTTTSPTEPSQGPGTTPVTFDSFDARWHAYSTAWTKRCETIWHDSPNGKLYDPDDIGSSYTVNDCLSFLDQLFMTRNVTSVAIATSEGSSDAASFTAQLTLSGKLCWIDAATDEIKGCWMGV